MPPPTRALAPCPTRAATAAQAAALNWGTVGPRQSADTGYTYTALPAAPAALPAFGRVDTSWFCGCRLPRRFADRGLRVNEYNIDVGGALVCGYEGISPNTVVNRATVTSPDRGEEVPLDVLAAAQPAKLYILIGMNALVQPGNDDSFLAYYGKMLDDLHRPAEHGVLCAVGPARHAGEGRRQSAGSGPGPSGGLNAQPFSSFVPSVGAIILTSAPRICRRRRVSRRVLPARRRASDGLRLQQGGSISLHPVPPARTTPIRPGAPTI